MAIFYLYTRRMYGNAADEAWGGSAYDIEFVTSLLPDNRPPQSSSRRDAFLVPFLPPARNKGPINDSNFEICNFYLLPLVGLKR